MPEEPSAVVDIEGARVLAKLGDSVTTDHISPAGAIKKDSPAGKYLAEHGVANRDFNSYGSRRGNHEVMIRGTFANIRLRNQLAPGTEGGFTVDFTTDGAPVTTIFEASEKYLAAGTPLVILSGKEYGSGSSRDWAAKGTALLGVRAVIAESYERIHRSNLIGMGVLPLQYPAGQNAESLGLTGEETFSFSGVTALNDGTIPKTVHVTRRRRRVRRRGPDRHPRRGGLLPPRRDHAVRPAEPAQGLSRPATPSCVHRSAGVRARGFVRLSAGRSGGSRTARRPSPARSARARRSGSAGCGSPGGRRRRTAGRRRRARCRR